MNDVPHQGHMIQRRSALWQQWQLWHSPLPAQPRGENQKITNKANKIDVASYDSSIPFDWYLNWVSGVGHSLDNVCKLSRLGQEHPNVSSNHPILGENRSISRWAGITNLSNKMKVRGRLCQVWPDWGTKGGPVSTWEQKVCHCIGLLNNSGIFKAVIRDGLGTQNL